MVKVLLCTLLVLCSSPALAEELVTFYKELESIAYEYVDCSAYLELAEQAVLNTKNNESTSDAVKSLKERSQLFALILH